MPIYAYRCETCGFAKDVLQKMSDPQLTDCLSCGQPTFKKQVTAAGFQLKGSGWYVTDFRGGKSGTSAPPVESGAAAPATATSTAATPASTTTSPAPVTTTTTTSSDSSNSSKSSTKTPSA
ncbi:MAG: FmdB family zinc ribbon protein [Pseudomonadota bacterium]